MAPTEARKALVATTLPETTMEAPQGTFPRQSTVVDYDASTADEWNQWVMRGV
jgi:hypothetical protein